MKTYEGKLDAKGMKFGIVIARFNEFISGKLLSGCIDGLNRHGTEEENIEVLELDINEAMTMIESGDIRDGKTIMLLQYIKLNNIL